MGVNERRGTSSGVYQERSTRFTRLERVGKCEATGSSVDRVSRYARLMEESVSPMGRLVFGALRDAWKGEAADFTPLLAQQVDDIGNAIGVDLASIGSIEVSAAGGRRIDILAEGTNGANFVIENQYGVLNHDHLTRGLAYAVASHSRGLIVIAEEHRDEFRAVANYLNELRDNDPERGVAVWLVEAKAVSIGNSPWATLFLTVVSPNSFTAEVELEHSSIRRRLAQGDFEAAFESEDELKIAREILDWWTGPDRTRSNRRYRIMANPVQAVLESRGPGVSGWRTVIGFYPSGQVAIPFGAYKGLNSGIGVDALGTEEFRTRANAIFGLKGTEVQARTSPGWLTIERFDVLKAFCSEVAKAYLEAKTELHGDDEQNTGTLEHTYIEVPGPDARWWTEISDFALTYNGYDRGADVDSLAGIDKQVRQTWDDDATLSNDLEICRAVLFFEQRRFRHLDAEPAGDDNRFVRAILGQIRNLSGGQVLGPADELP